MKIFNFDLIFCAQDLFLIQIFYSSDICNSWLFFLNPIETEVQKNECRQRIIMVVFQEVDSTQ